MAQKGEFWAINLSCDWIGGFRQLENGYQFKELSNLSNLYGLKGGYCGIFLLSFSKDKQL